MSDLLYSTRLRWGGGRGVARLHGRSVALTAPPVLPGCEALAIDRIDYTPEVHACSVMERFGGWREMTGEEIRAADEFLRRLHAANTDKEPTDGA